MASNSSIITTKEITEAKEQIANLRKLIREVELAEKAGIDVETSSKEIQAMIDRLEVFIKVYQS